MSSSGDWQPVWDANSKKYYYWNKKTQETSWINKTGTLTPLPPTTASTVASTTVVPATVSDSNNSIEKKKGSESSPGKGKEAEGAETIAATGEAADYYSSKEYYEWYMNVVKEHQIQQSANQTAASVAAGRKAEKNDRFAELALIGAGASTKVNRDFKQMSYYFDIEKYHQDRAQERLQPKVVKKVTRKEIEKFKQKKHEKKVASLIQRMGADT